MGKLDGQVAIVVGASSGMGQATALAFAAEGAKVVLAARRAQPIKELAATISGRGEQAIACVTDVTKRAEVDALVQTTLSAFGRVDVLVNAAGINTPDRALARLTPETWQRVIDINLTGAYHCTQAVLPPMREQKNGVIVHISSVSGKWGDISGAAYQSSKHGLIGLCYATMFEERRHGIRVTALCPGLCDTPILRNRPVPIPREILDQAMQPEDIAAACLFVASLPPRTYVPELMVMAAGLQCIGQASV